MKIPKRIRIGHCPYTLSNDQSMREYYEIFTTHTRIIELYQYSHLPPIINKNNRIYDKLESWVRTSYINQSCSQIMFSDHVD